MTGSFFLGNNAYSISWQETNATVNSIFYNFMSNHTYALTGSAKGWGMEANFSFTHIYNFFPTKNDFRNAP